MPSLRAIFTWPSKKRKLEPSKCSVEGDQPSSFQGTGTFGPGQWMYFGPGQEQFPYCSMMFTVSAGVARCASLSSHG